MRLLLCLLPLLAGCALVDQTTFDPALRARLFPPPKTVSAPPLAAREPGPPPLLTVAGDADYEDSLRLAVRQALARKPDARFEVVTMVDGDASAGDQVAQAGRDGARARRMAGEIEALGVDSGQIALGARPGAAKGSETRVYVR